MQKEAFWTRWFQLKSSHSSSEKAHNDDGTRSGHDDVSGGDFNSLDLGTSTDYIESWSSYETIPATTTTTTPKTTIITPSTSSSPTTITIAPDSVVEADAETSKHRKSFLKLKINLLRPKGNEKIDHVMEMKQKHKWIFDNSQLKIYYDMFMYFSKYDPVTQTNLLYQSYARDLLTALNESEWVIQQFISDDDNADKDTDKLNSRQSSLKPTSWHDRKTKSLPSAVFRKKINMTLAKDSLERKHNKMYSAAPHHNCTRACTCTSITSPVQRTFTESSLETAPSSSLLSHTPAINHDKSSSAPVLSSATRLLEKRANTKHKHTHFSDFSDGDLPQRRTYGHSLQYGIETETESDMNRSSPTEEGQKQKQENENDRERGKQTKKTIVEYPCDFVTWVNALESLLYGFTDSDLKLCFDTFDQDKNGYLDRDEFINILCLPITDLILSREEANTVFDIVDLDGDEKFQFSEFVQFLSTMGILPKEVTKSATLEAKKNIEAGAKIQGPLDDIGRRSDSGSGSNSALGTSMRTCSEK